LREEGCHGDIAQVTLLGGRGGYRGVVIKWPSDCLTPSDASAGASKAIEGSTADYGNKEERGSTEGFCLRKGCIE